MTEFSDLDRLENEIETLETTMGLAAGMAAAFEQELGRVNEGFTSAGRDAEVLSGGLSRGLSKAFDGLAYEGLKLSDALKVVADSAINATFRAATDPVADQVGGVLGGAITNLVDAILPF